MAYRFYLGDLSAEQVEKFLTLELVLEGYKISLDLMKKGEASGQKCFQYFPQDELWEQPEYAPFKEKYAEKPFEWRYNVAETWTAGLLGMKEIFSNIANDDIKLSGDDDVRLPRHMATVLIRNRFSGMPFGKLDGIEISNARSAFPALKMMELCFTGFPKIAIFILGARGLAEWHVRLLVALYAERISSITICSPERNDREPSSITLVNKLRKELGSTPVALSAVTDHELLPKADFIIGTTNNGTPTFKKEQLAPHVRTLSCSADEMPAGHIEDVLKNGHPICLNIKSCSERGGQSLQLWFERQGKRLADEAQKYGVLELATMGPLEENDRRPVHGTSVGSAVPDLILGALVLLEHAKEMKQYLIERMLRKCLNTSM